MVNYIVSGIERTGTSMMMQVLDRGGASVAYDESREPDYHNPKGYYELEGGKIIGKLRKGTFSLDEYENKVVKITAYGLKFLPKRAYKIVYMTRDLNEVMDSMEKMSGSINRKKEKPLFKKLHEFSLDLMENRDDIEYIVVNHRDIIEDPLKEAERVNDFLGGMLNVESGAQAVDPDLYRNVRK
ncbi:MAG: nucleotide pyrophosphatase [Euryarchaeota archaeon]|nr:nucleotide pyrophosphatase [Euryarchaeota archaeon]